MSLYPSPTIPALVHETTFSPSGQHRHYLSIVELQFLLETIITTGETTACVQAIPFSRPCTASRSLTA